MNGWPAALRLRTRKYLDGVEPFPDGDVLQMKSLCNFSAYLKKSDLLNGQIILYDHKSKATTEFQSAGELFEAGWVADLQDAASADSQISLGKTSERLRLLRTSKIYALPKR